MKIAGWLGLLRPPFHTFGILPFLLGTLLAWRLDHHLFRLPVFVLSLCGIALVMLSTYYTGEYVERTATVLLHRPRANPFAEKSGGMLKIGTAAFALAVVIALILQFGLHTGPLTLLLGYTSALPGFCYATRSCRYLVDRGFGELLISFSYSWPPIAAGFYLQQGTIAPCIHWMALPIGLSIFNVILLNEYANLPAAAAGQTPLLTLLGKTKGMALHVLCSILSWFWMFSSLNAGVPRKALYLYLPVLTLSAGISLMMARRKYENPFLLEWLCGLNIAVYLGTAMTYLLAFF